MSVSKHAPHAHTSFQGNPKTEAVGQKARQLRAQAAASGVPTPSTDKNAIGRAAVSAEPDNVRKAQAKGMGVRMKGNA